MSRLILTFETLFLVLAADKLLKSQVRCRPTPTPAGLSASICGMSIELLESDRVDFALALLHEAENDPAGVHQID